MYIPHHKKSPSPKSSQRRWLQDFVHFCFSLTTRPAEFLWLLNTPWIWNNMMIHTGCFIRRTICTNIDNISIFAYIIFLISTVDNHHRLFDLFDVQTLLNIGECQIRHEVPRRLFFQLGAILGLVTFADRKPGDFTRIVTSFFRSLNIEDLDLYIERKHFALSIP